MTEGNGADRPDGGGGSDDGSPSPGAGEGVEVVTLSDSQGLGVYVTCGADLPPADLVAGLCDILTQVTGAALERRPGAKRAADLGLGDDVF